MEAYFAQLLNSTTMLVLQVVGSFIVVLWVIDSYREYRLKKRRGFDFTKVRRRNALLVVVIFLFVITFFIVDTVLNSGFGSLFVFVIKCIWLLACFVWIIWRVNAILKRRDQTENELT